MSSAGLQPLPYFETGVAGKFLTFVVPAGNGCNLKCPFCLVRQRGENFDVYLRPEDLARFIREAAEVAPIFALTIQGYEPLLPKSQPYTQSILATGRFLGLPTSLVTNGVNLTDAINLLTTLAPSLLHVREYNDIGRSSVDAIIRVLGLDRRGAGSFSGRFCASESFPIRTQWSGG
jgi:hypothetical protein